MNVFQTNTFKKAIKKLYTNQRIIVDETIRTIISNPLIGTEKVGDLADVRVYKFYVINQLFLLAYKYEEIKSTIILLALGTHENFYRDLKS
jgi:mRNA-degrading endonuclease RelE of RelBE toxin-antitoxin system